MNPITYRDSLVYRLQATGTDWFTGSSKRTISSTTLFTTRKLAEGRLEKFRALCVEKRILLGDSIVVRVVPLEIVNE